MYLDSDGRRVLTPEEQKQVFAFEQWFKEKKDNYDVWGNGDDFCVDDEIKRFCYLAYIQGVTVTRVAADKAYCEKANAEIKLEEAKELLREYTRLSLQEPENKDMIANIELFKKTEQFLQDLENRG